MKRLAIRLRSQRGIALLIVMMATLALSIVVVEFVYSTRVHYDMARNLRDRLQAEYMARSAVQISLLVIKFQKQLDSVQSQVGQNATVIAKGPIFQQIPIDTYLLRLGVSAGEGTAGVNIGLNDQEKKNLGSFLAFPGNFSAKIGDEQGKINVNALASTLEQGAQAIGQVNATPTPSPGSEETGTNAKSATGTTVGDVAFEQLLALTEGKDYDYIFSNNMTRQEVIYNMLDWVDPDSDRSGFSGGLEDSLYSTKTPPYQAKNARLDSVAELTLIEGVTPAFMDAFGSSLTVFGNSNKVNLNTAPVPLLKGLVGRLIRSKNDEEIARIVDWIDEHRDFSNQQEFVQGMQTLFGFDANDLDAKILSSFTFKPSIFSITATGTAGDEAEGNPVTVNIHAVISYSQNPTSSINPKPLPTGFQILYWRID